MRPYKAHGSKRELPETTPEAGGTREGVLKIPPCIEKGKEFQNVRHNADRIAVAVPEIILGRPGRKAENGENVSAMTPYRDVSIERFSNLATRCRQNLLFQTEMYAN